MKLLGKILDQIAEIDTAIGCEVKDRFTAVENVLHLHQFHVEIAFGDLCLAEEMRLLFPGAVTFCSFEISLSCLANNCLQRLRCKLSVCFRGRGGHNSHTSAPVGFNDHPVAAL